MVRCLPTDTDAFGAAYIPDIASYMEKHMNIPGALGLIMQATVATAALHPGRLNKDVFFAPFAPYTSLNADEFERELDAYYNSEYSKFKALCRRRAPCGGGAAYLQGKRTENSHCYESVFSAAGFENARGLGGDSFGAV